MQLFKNSNQIVREIHNEFDSAQERLLTEARAIINSNLPQLSNKAERLERIGFINSETVVKNKKIRESLVKNTEQAKLIEYYKQTYPFQKFLTESELDRICKKYNLIHAPVTNYKKEVPDKNLLEIEQSTPLKSNDSAKNRLWCELDYNGSLDLGNSTAKRLNLPFIIDNHFLNTTQVDNILKGRFPQIKDERWIVNSIQNFTKERLGLFIAAPKSHFNLKGLKKNGLFGFSNISMLEVKDPIVFRHCRGGIQVLSKWGLEGNDEALVNEKYN